MRIVLVVIQRVPADVVAKREVEDKRDEGGPPPASLPVKLAARAPRPVAVVINPAPVVIRRPAPRLVTNPRPAVRRAPGPLAVAIRRPIAVDAERASARPPDPAVVVRVDPVAVVIEIFSAKDVFVEIFNVSFSTRGEILLALFHPFIDSIGCLRRRIEIPVACIGAAGDQLGCALVAQGETRSVRINASLAALAHGQTNASLARCVDAVKSFLLGCKGGPGRVYLEILFIAVKLCQPQYERALDETDRDSLITQSDDPQHRVVSQAHEVSRIDLDFELATLAGRDCVAFDQRIVHASGLPILVTGASQVDLAADQADTRDSGFHFVIVGVVFVVVSADRNCYE